MANGCREVRWGFAAVGAGVMLALGAAAEGQISILSQSRFVEGVTHNVAEDGTMFDVGPNRTEAPAGFYGSWDGTMVVPGNITASGQVVGGWDGQGTIQIDSMMMTIGGGGGPGSSGTSSLQVHFEYQFEVPTTSTYTLDGFFGSSAPIVVGLQITGPSLNINQDSSMSETVSYVGQTGTLSAGVYTLAFNGQGTVSYVGPGGNGAGGGGNQPLLTFTVTPAACAADFNHSGSLSVQDIFDFLGAYFVNDPSADFNASGGVTVQDIFDFLGAYFVGCA